MPEMMFQLSGTRQRLQARARDLAEGVFRGRAAEIDRLLPEPVRRVELDGFPYRTPATPPRTGAGVRPRGPRSKGGGRASYRGMVKVYPGAEHCKVSVECDALLIDADSRSDTYPTMEIAEDNVKIEHEARVSKVSEEQLFYLTSRGLSEDEARLLIVNGFIEPFTKELPMEYAVELNRLIELEMEGSIG